MRVRVPGKKKPFPRTLVNVMDKGLARLDGCRGSRVRVKAHRIDEARAGGVPDATPLFVSAHPNKIPGREQ